MACPIHIGIAGWSYKDWQDIVYTDRKIDQLVYISRFVDCIEINSTFYRPPFAKTTQSWLQRTSEKPAFFFTAKLHRDITHQGKLDPVVIDQFHTGFAPMLEEGKLRALLVQFRYDFNDNNTNRQHLYRIVESFCEAFNLAVELRHNSWEKPDALEFLGKLGVSVCNLDYPVGSTSRLFQDARPECCQVVQQGGQR
jgi:uncharacterized protein YecE (DUF72 family)